MLYRPELLHTLASAARDHEWLSLAWNVALLAWLMWLALSRRPPDRRLAFAVACAPLLSAVVVAWRSELPVDAFELTALAFASLVIGLQLPAGAVAWSPRGRRLLAIAAMLMAAWSGVSSSALGTYGAIGVLPAPTVLWLAGAGLLVRGFGTRAWSYWVGGFALGYGALGVGVLGTWRDLALLPAGVALIVSALASRRDQKALASERARIDRFLQLRRIAVVGVSRKEADFSRMIWESLRARGIDAIPVHRHAPVIGDQLAYPFVSEVPGTLRGALIMTAPEHALQVVQDCARAGVRQLWFHRGIGHGSASPEAIAYARAHELSVISDRCIMMFLEDRPVSIHRLHAVADRALGQYPACE